VRELPAELTEGLAALDRLSPMQERARKDVFYDEFDQRPRYEGDSPIAARNRMREGGRYDPASKPAVKQAAPGVGGVGPGARVKHPSFGVGTVEDVDGDGLNRKLVVRFGPGVGLKKVLARFIDPA
jgi:DNA helicase-2/ATP-dependent DNA helicase PcrA